MINKRNDIPLEPGRLPEENGEKDILLVVKIGGQIIDDGESLSSFLQAFAELDAKRILVHGGGRKATRLAESLGIEQQMIDGRRITDAKTLEIVTMVYAGDINKSIVARLQSHHCNALGLCGADGNLVRAHKRVHPSIDYGFAGDIDEVNTRLLKTLLENQFVPVICPITHDRMGQLLNTNADTIAQEIGKSLSQDYAVHLVYSFEKDGVLLDVHNEDSVIRALTPGAYRRLRAEKKIFAGMIPKLDNAFEALECGVKQVTIGRAEVLNDLIHHRAGTTIIHDAD